MRFGARPITVMRMEPSDETLARRAAKGDRDAFGALVARVYDRQYRLAFRLTGRRDEAEDIAQDICVSLPSRLQGWREEGKLTTWLHRITVNAVRDRYRRNASYSRAATGWGDWEENRRAVAAEANERRDWLAMAMDTLTPPELRETLVLMLDGLSHAEIAEILGVSPGTVSWRISEAKKKLKAMREEAA